MTLQNRFNLPAALVAAIERHEHKGAKYSVSMLPNSPRQVWLKKRHADEVVADAVDRVWATLGTAWHAMNHEHAGPNEMSEEYMDEILAGVPVSGTADLFYGDGCLDELKTTSVWSIVHESRLDEWTKQLNSYALGLSRRGCVVKKLRAVVLMRDWRAGEAARTAGYPPCMVVVMDIPLWSPAEQEAHIRGRAALFDKYEQTPDDQLPLCTAEERWESGGKPPKRCALYCDGFAFCNQRQAELGSPPKAPARKAIAPPAAQAAHPGAELPANKAGWDDATAAAKAAGTTLAEVRKHLGFSGKFTAGQALAVIGACAGKGMK